MEASLSERAMALEEFVSAIQTVGVQWEYDQRMIDRFIEAVRAALSRTDKAG